MVKRIFIKVKNKEYYELVEFKAKMKCKTWRGLLLKLMRQHESPKKEYRPREKIGRREGYSHIEALGDAYKPHHYYNR